MRAWTHAIGNLRALAPTAMVLLMVTLITGLASAGRLPGTSDVVAAETRRDVLLSYLPDVDRVSYARNVLYLYVHGAPLMVVWVEDDPAQLYEADGRFVTVLDFQELSRVIRRASTLMAHDRRWRNAPEAARRDQA